MVVRASEFIEARHFDAEGIQQKQQALVSRYRDLQVPLTHTHTHAHTHTYTHIHTRTHTHTHMHTHIHTHIYAHMQSHVVMGGGELSHVHVH